MMKNFHISLLVFLFSFLTTLSSNSQDQLVQYEKLVGPERRQLLRYGTDVAMNDSYFMVSSHFENYELDNEDPLGLAGAVYVYQYDVTGEYKLVQRLVAPERDRHHFGQSIALSDEYLLVGCPRTAQANMFKYTEEGTWEHVQKILHPDTTQRENFGSTVEIYDDLLFVSNWQENYGGYNYQYNYSVCVYKILPDDEIELLQVLRVDSPDYDTGKFGRQIEYNGQSLLISSTTGKYYHEGEYNYFRGLIHCYSMVADTFVEVQTILPDDGGYNHYGFSMSLQGNQLVIGAEDASLDENGMNEMTGAGAIYIYELNSETGSWELNGKKVASDRHVTDRFGSSVSINDGYIAVGSPGNLTNVEGGNIIGGAGACYFFREDLDQSWVEECKFVANDRNEGDEVGYAIANNGRFVVSTSSQVDDDEYGGDPIRDAGAAYIFGPEKPEILIDIINKKSCEGEEAIELEVKALGADLHYRWYKDKVFMAGETDRSLSIPSVISNNGNYHCLIQNYTDTISTDTIFVEIVPTTQILTHPLNLITCEDATSLELSVVAEGKELSYQWYMNDVVLSGEQASSLLVVKQPENSATYNCQVTGFCGIETSVGAEIDIRPLNHIISIPENIQRCPGEDTISLEVEHLGSAEKYFWRSDAGLDTITQTPVIRIPALPEYSGSYDVIVDGECSTESSEEFTITIWDTPQITQHPVSVSASPQSATFFAVSASGDSLNYQWTFNGLALADSENLQGADTDTLHILSASWEYAGDYSCIVSGFCGEETSESATLDLHVSGELYEGSEISAWPNPVTEGELYLDNLPEGAMIQVLTMDGLVLIAIKNSGDKVSLDVSDLPAGLYLLKVYIGNKESGKIISIQ